MCRYEVEGGIENSWSRIPPSSISTSHGLLRYGKAGSVRVDSEVSCLPEETREGWAIK